MSTRFQDREVKGDISRKIDYKQGGGSKQNSAPRWHGLLRSPTSSHSPSSLGLGLPQPTPPHHVQAWARRCPGQQVPHDPRSARGRGDELLRQQRGQEPVHHLGVRDQGSPEPPAVRRCRGHGDGHRPQGKAGAQEEGDARRGGEAAQGLEAEGRRLHLLRGQRRRHCQQQGRDEGLRYQRPRCQGVRRPVAPYRQQRRLHRLRRE